MSEIKFACPHCGQHIACSRDYADLGILCPSCSQPMEVPRLSATDASHPDMCVVASVPRPKQRFSSRIPTIDVWTEKEWEDRYRAASTPAQHTPGWVVSALGTVVAAALLKAAQAPSWAIIVCILGGGAFSCYLLRKDQLSPGSGLAPGSLASAGSALGRIALLLLAIFGAAVGLLFVGCSLCG